jgi:glycosyltransferase involved in cell wall biosynthesis
MRHVYFVVPDLGYGSHGRQVSLLAPGLRRAEWSTSVYSLAGDGPFGPAIRAELVAVERQTGYAARDLRSWAVLRWMIPRSGQGTVHAFGLRVLRRLVAASLRMRRPRIVLSLTGRERLTWFDRRCLRSVSRIVVPHSSAADALTRHGVPRDKVSVVSLAVGDAPPQPDRTEFCRMHGLPADAKLIMTAGWMKTRDSLFGAVWAFEFLRYIDENARLLVIGDGPARETIRSGAIGLAPEGSRVHFLGALSDVPAVLGLADLVLVPQLSGGANVALEAMAAGRAVIAANTPDLSAVIRDGDTCVLVPAGNAHEMARAMRRLFLDVYRHAQLCKAAQRQVREQHSISTIVQMMEAVYRE